MFPEIRFVCAKGRVPFLNHARQCDMKNWPDRRLLDLLKLEIPIIQAPMAGYLLRRLTRE
jgi:hypothetical protein